MNLRIKQDSENVLLLANGKLLLDLPYPTALEIAKALKEVAKRAEEWAQAERIAADQALLLRSGAPFGITNHPKILDEAKKQAVHDRVLRRALPGGIRSMGVVGAPTITQHQPKAL